MFQIKVYSYIEKRKKKNPKEKKKTPNGNKILLIKELFLERCQLAILKRFIYKQTNFGRESEGKK